MEITKIKDIKSGMNGLNLIANVKEKSPISIHNGKKYARALLEDDTGQIKLNLWRDQTEQFEVGDSVIIRQVFAHTRGRVLQISTWEKIEIKH